jgi:hypothetical protein
MFLESISSITVGFCGGGLIFGFGVKGASLTPPLFIRPPLSIVGYSVMIFNILIFIPMWCHKYMSENCVF